MQFFLDNWTFLCYITRVCDFMSHSKPLGEVEIPYIRDTVAGESQKDRR